MNTRKVELMSGAQFVDWLRAEIKKRNNSEFTSFSVRALAMSAGLSDVYVNRLLKSEKPNPTALSQRLIAYSLGVEIERPEEDVIPHRVSKGLPRTPSTIEAV